MGGIPKEKIDEVVKKAMPKFSACNASHTLIGKVETRFTIGPDGKVKEANILKSSLNNKAAEACVIGEVKQLVFPAPEGGGIVDVEYPFSFSQKKLR